MVLNIFNICIVWELLVFHSYMTLCLKHIDVVSMVTTIVVIVTMNYIGVVTIGHVVNKLDPSLVIDIVPKIV